MKLIVIGETSGIVRDAFLALGHDAWSNDILPAERPSNRHIICDGRDLLKPCWWDMMIVAHPPCTRLCNSGVRWLSVPPPGKTAAQMQRELEEGAELFSAFLNAPINKIAVENPVMHRHAKALIANYQPPTQSVQPWQFGHGETKRTCLWLKNLPPLVPTQVVAGRKPKVHYLGSTMKDRWKVRSRTYPGIAAAMANQWGGDALQQIAA